MFCFLNVVMFALFLCISSVASVPSAGCGSEQIIGKPGETISWTTTYLDVEYTQKLTLPATYSQDVPAPLQMHHHGWGGTSDECDSACSTQAPSFGFVAVAIQGIGQPGWASWNGSGTVASPSKDRGATCQTNAADYCGKYPECGSCADNCYWTTCHDSVDYVLGILDTLQDTLCLDLDMIWASGCSNGGIFLYELAKDSRISGRLAGIAPIVGVPHNGFNVGPMYNMNFIGMFGTSDTTVPALEPTNTNQLDVNVDTGSGRGGWYFQTARSTTDMWGDCMDCDRRRNTTEWTIGSHKGLTCTKRSCLMEETDVVECVFSGGHVCNLAAQWDPIYAFMLAHPRKASTARAPLTCPDPVIPAPFLCTAAHASCVDATECCSNKCDHNRCR